MQARIKEQEEAQAAKRALEAMGELKLLALKDAAETLQNNINTLSPILFFEPMRFAINVDVNTMDILATRSDGKISDIRHLSGAESRMFSCEQAARRIMHDA